MTSRLDSHEIAQSLSANNAQMDSAMDLDDAPDDADTKVDRRKAAKAKRLATKQKQVINKEKFDKKRAEERRQADEMKISFHEFQQRQRFAGREREARRLVAEAAEKGLLTQERLGQTMFDLPDHLKSQTLAFSTKVPAQSSGPTTLGPSLFEHFNKIKNQTAESSTMVPSRSPAPTKTYAKKEKVTELQKGAGRNLTKLDKNLKKNEFLKNSTYKVTKKSTHRDKEAKERKREKVAAAVAQKDLEDLTVAMLESLVITGRVEVEHRGQKVAPDVGIWDMFGGKPVWYTPLPVVDPRIVDLFPLGQVSSLFTGQIYPLSNAQYRRQFADSLDMGVRRLEACFNRTRGPKPAAIGGPAIKELSRFEQSLKSGGAREPFVSQLHSIQQNQYIVALKVQAMREGKAVDGNDIMAQKSTTRIPVTNAREEGLRRQPLLRERAFRNIVKITMLREEAAANTMNVDMDADDDVVEISNPFANRVIFGAGIPLAPRLLKNGLTFKDAAAMKAEVKAIQGDARPPRSQPHVITEEGEAIRCICGGLEADDDYDGKWIQCEKCEVWQHNICVGASLDDEELAELHYFCEECEPEDHEEYFEATERGEEIWQTRMNRHEVEVEEEEERIKVEKRKRRKAKGHLLAWLDDMEIKVEDDDA